MEYEKPYCKEGESKSHVALAFAMLWCVFWVMALLMFLWAIGAIRP